MGEHFVTRPSFVTIFLKNTTTNNNNRMELIVLLSTVATLITAAPDRQRNIRAAPEYESVCKAAELAYTAAREEGKSAKIAGVVAAKTFYVKFFEDKITGIVPACKNTVDA